MLINYEKLPIKITDVVKDLGLNHQVCYRSIAELEMYNIVERVDYGLIDFSFSARKRRPVGVLIRSPEQFDDMACAYREEDEKQA